MLMIFWLLFVSACAYGAYRAIRGGFERPQSDKWTGYSIIGIAVMLMLAVWLYNNFFG